MSRFYLAYSIYETPSRKLQNEENQLNTINLASTSRFHFQTLKMDLQTQIVFIPLCIIPNGIIHKGIK